MKKFMGFFGTSHLNNRNVAAYENEGGCLLVVENVISDEALSELQFESYAAADEWFSTLPGHNNLARLKTAIDSIYWDY